MIWATDHWPTRYSAGLGWLPTIGIKFRVRPLGQEVFKRVWRPRRSLGPVESWDSNLEPGMGIERGGVGSRLPL